MDINDADYHEINALFTEFDKDKSGNLELSELKVAFKRALALSQDVQARTMDAMTWVTTWQQRSSQANDLADQTQEYEDEKKRLAFQQNTQGQVLVDKLGSFFSVTKGNGLLVSVLGENLGLICKLCPFFALAPGYCE